MQGFSGVIAERDGTLLAVVDNGYGAMENSADFHLRVYRLRPDFDSRLYGHRKFSDLVRSMPERFELDERGTGAGKSIFVRLAPRPGKAAGGKRTPRKTKT